MPCLVGISSGSSPGCKFMLSNILRGRFTIHRVERFLGLQTQVGRKSNRTLIRGNAREIDCCSSCVTRGDVVEMDTWVAASRKNGMRRDWLVRDYKTGQILARATR